MTSTRASLGAILQGITSAGGRTMVGGVPERRLRAAQRAFPKLGRAEIPDLIFLALLHEPGLDIVDDADGSLAESESKALEDLLLEDVRARVDAMRDLKHHDVASWLGTYWLPVTPAAELHVVRAWGPVEYEPLPDHQELPVTSAAQFWVMALFNARSDFDEYLDHECHVEMRRLASETLKPHRFAGIEPEEVWEYRTRGPGWHHGSE